MLGLVQQASNEMALPAPTSVIGSTTQDTVQLLALLNGLGNNLARGFNWQFLEKEYRFTTSYLATTGDTNSSTVITNLASTAGLDSTYMLSGAGINQDTYVSSVDSSTQVTLSQAATATATGVALTFSKTKYSLPSDWDRQINRTHFDKSKRWEMLGPETPQQWQWLKSAYISTGPRIRYRIMGNYFQIWPLLGTNEYLGFEYVSKYWILGATDTVPTKSSFTVDTDTCIFPDRLIVSGLKLMYFQIKGFDTTAFQRDYDEQMNLAKLNDQGAATLSFSPRVSSVLIGWENIPDSGYGS